MGFSCTIKQGKKDLTTGDFVSYKLFGLAPSGDGDTDAPYRIEDLRSVVSQCLYGDRLEEAAQDCFTTLQEMVRRNLESLEQHHCQTCKCPPKNPRGWGGKATTQFLEISPTSITYISGGY